MINVPIDRPATHTDALADKKDLLGHVRPLLFNHRFAKNKYPTDIANSDASNARPAPRIPKTGTIAKVPPITIAAARIESQI